MRRVKHLLLSLCLISACVPTSSGSPNSRQIVSQSLTPSSKGERLTPSSKGERGSIRAVLKLAQSFAPGTSGPLVADYARISLEGTNLQAFSDQKGYFELKDIPLNRKLNLIAEKANARGQNFRVLQSAELSSEKPELELAPLLLQATGRLQGRIQVKDSETALAGVDVFVPGTLLSTRSDEQGHFIMGDVPVGSYRLKIRKEGFAEVSTDLVHIEEGRLTDVPLIQLSSEQHSTSSASISGQVISQGQVIAGASVVLISPDGQDYVTRSDIQGHYAFKVIPLQKADSAAFQIFVNKLFYQSVQVDVQLKASSDLQQDIELKSTRFYPGRLNLTVHDCQGNALPNALIQLNPALALSPIVFTDLKGQAKLNTLPPGKYTVQVARGQYSTFEGVVIDNQVKGSDGQSGAFAKLNFILGDCPSN